jgi:DNA-binding response OmpR family regulator
MTERTIMVVDDEPLITQSLKYSLELEGFRVLVAEDGLSALDLARRESPDLIVLDVMLPGADGWEVCRRLREESTVPVIMLTARGSEIDRVLGLELGADDYLCKPFSFRELLARIRATFRRISFEGQPRTAMLHSGNLRMDTAAHKVYRDESEVAMTQKEYDLLRVLLSRAGQVVSRAELLDQVWGVDWVGDVRTLDVHIRWLREKLEDDPGNPLVIQTVRGVGYRASAPAEKS